MADLDNERQARHTLAELYRKYKKPIAIADAPAGLSLGELDRLIKSHEIIVRKECASAFIGLLASNPVLTNLPAPMVRKQIEDAIGIK